MKPTEYIDRAIERAEALPWEQLSSCERKIFLISEAEVLTDKDGIDSFILKHSGRIQESAEAFAAVGAKEIATGLAGLVGVAEPEEPILDKLNELITGRVGYGPEDVEKYVAKFIAESAGA